MPAQDSWYENEEKKNKGILYVLPARFDPVGIRAGLRCTARLDSGRSVFGFILDLYPTMCIKSPHVSFSRILRFRMTVQGGDLPIAPPPLSCAPSSVFLGSLAMDPLRFALGRDLLNSLSLRTLLGLRALFPLALAAPQAHMPPFPLDELS